MNSDNRKEWNNNRKNTLTPSRVREDGYGMMDNGIQIDLTLFEHRSPDGDFHNVVAIFYTPTMDSDGGGYRCAGCGQIIPTNRPVFLMTNLQHMYPCLDEGKWVWWTVSSRGVKTLEGME